jgi:hypothetical protein
MEIDLERLSPSLCIALGAACVERALPLFTGLISSDAPANAVDTVWRWLSGETCEDDRRQILKTLEVDTPDVDVMGSGYTPEMDVGVAAIHMLKAIDRNPRENIRHSLYYAHEAFEMSSGRDTKVCEAEENWQQRAFALVSNSTGLIERAAFAQLLGEKLT